MTSMRNDRERVRVRDTGELAGFTAMVALLAILVRPSGGRGR
jgi:hypothetical protein